LASQADHEQPIIRRAGRCAGVAKESSSSVAGHTAGLRFVSHNRDAVELTDQQAEEWLRDRLLNRVGRSLGRAVMIAWLVSLVTHLILMQTVFNSSAWVTSFGYMAYGLSALLIVTLLRWGVGFRPLSALLTGVLANSVHITAIMIDKFFLLELLLALPLLIWVIIVSIGYAIALRIGVENFGRICHAPRLLVLRTFGLQGNTSTLFGLVGRRWTLVGPAVTISDPSLAEHRFSQLKKWLALSCFGPALGMLVGLVVTGRDSVLDSASSSILYFIIGLMSYTVFLAAGFLYMTIQLRMNAPYNLEAIEQRLMLETRGSLMFQFPFIRLSCYDDLWKATVDGLINWTDVVLMDARAFTAEKAGVTHELRVILSNFPLQLTVFLVDATSNWDYFKKSLRAEWESLRADTALGDEKFVTVNVYQAEDQGRHFQLEIPGLISLLVEATALVPSRKLDTTCATSRWLRRGTEFI
jgi:hypothetical protein